MRTFATAGVLTCIVLVAARPGFAQTAAFPRPFVDGAFMAEADPTELFDGPNAGIGGRIAIGGQLSNWNGFRFELDVPRWRAIDTNTFGSAWCAQESDCLTKGVLIPAHTTTHTSYRTLSYSFLYSFHLAATRRVQLAVLGGGAIEQQETRDSQTFDELGASGEVLRHHAYSDNRTNYSPGLVVGVDAEVRVSSHLAVTPQFRFHTFPYPEVSVIRPGIAVRWNF